MTAVMFNSLCCVNDSIGLFKFWKFLISYWRQCLPNQFPIWERANRHHLGRGSPLQKRCELSGQTFCVSHCYWSELLTVWGSLLVWDVRYRPMVLLDPPLCLTKVLPKAVRCREKHLVLFFAIILQRKCFPVPIKLTTLQHPPLFSSLQYVPVLSH